MNDCPNAEIRDQLPDLLHDRLSVSARAAVMAHVSSCADCRDELELLRGVRGMLVARTPRVDVAWVVGALPKPGARRPQVTAARRTWMDWRVAAAVTLLAAGGTSVAVFNRVGVSGAPVAEAPLRQDSALAMSVATEPPSVAAQAPSAPSTPAIATKAAPSASTESPEMVASAEDMTPTDLASDVGADGRLASLNERQLQALLGEIDRLQPVPVTESDPISLRINSRSVRLPEGG